MVQRFFNYRVFPNGAKSSIFFLWWLFWFLETPRPSLMPSPHALFHTWTARLIALNLKEASYAFLYMCFPSWGCVHDVQDASSKQNQTTTVYRRPTYSLPVCLALVLPARALLANEKNYRLTASLFVFKTREKVAVYNP